MDSTPVRVVRIQISVRDDILLFNIFLLLPLAGKSSWWNRLYIQCFVQQSSGTTVGKTLSLHVTRLQGPEETRRSSFWSAISMKQQQLTTNRDTLYPENAPVNRHQVQTTLAGLHQHPAPT